MCVGAFISVCQQTKATVGLYFYFYHVITFSWCFCFGHSIMEKHLHLKKSITVLLFWACNLVASLYSWKYHSNTMVREVLYPYKRAVCSIVQYH